VSIAVTKVGLDAPALRGALGHVPAGIVAVCAEVVGERTGMAVSSFVPVSLDPPLVGFCVQRTSTTWPRMRASEQIGISVLGARHDAAVRSLASKTGDRFSGLTTKTGKSGALFIDGASVWLATTVESEVEAGDHLIVVLIISEVWVCDGVDPIVFHRSSFRRLMPGH
jgi:flavin reductase (DIM6/NTAB) family NADH-FMN oxidoreductase RutF